MSGQGLASFRTRLLLGVCIPVFALIALGVALELFQFRDRYHRALDVEANLITDIVGEALVQPLWDFDTQQVQRTLDDLLDVNDLGLARITGPDGATLAQAQAPWFSADLPQITVDRALTYALGDQTEALGTLTVALSTQSVATTLQHLMWQKVGIALGILALIAVAVFWVLSRLSQPLVAMARVIENIGTRNPQALMPGTGRRDELGQVAAALNHWQQNESEIAELRALNDEVARRDRRRIRGALQSTQDAIILADERGLIVFANAHARQLFGGAAPGKPLQFGKWLLPDHATQVTGACRDRTEFTLETTLHQRAEHRQLHLLLRGGPILDQDGSLLGTMVLATDQTEQVQQARRAQYLSEHDSLTGLPNRRLLEQTLQTWIATEGQPVCVLLADLDRFKQINDTLGHPVGDTLLQHVATCLGDQITSDDLAARLGGDEFAVIGKGPDSAARLRDLATALVTAFSRPQEVNGRVLHTGFSIGITDLAPDCTDPLDGIRRADLALYQAKRHGRGRAEEFHSDLEDAIRRKSQLDTALRIALRKRAIAPVFQMQTDLQTGAITGFEALARWTDDRLGPVSPAEFVPIAENAGLITEMTHQILMHSCQAAAAWHKTGFTGRVAVNLSPTLFGDKVADMVRDCLLITGCPAARLEVEITETVFLSNGDAAHSQIAALRQAGITVALDDFGVGYSSLGYLQQFPVDKIKIDRAFVSALPQSDETKAIVRAISALGHAMGMTVTGEGAETEAHRACLRACQVDVVQGYVDGMPMSYEAATALISPSLPQQATS